MLLSAQDVPGGGHLLDTVGIGRFGLRSAIIPTSSVHLSAHFHQLRLRSPPEGAHPSPRLARPDCAAARFQA